jgi:hypothetical protein
LAIFSDVHAQVRRLSACLEAVARTGADELWCLGDAVDGLSARPPELTAACVRAINDVCTVKLAGNHEAWALQDQSLPAAAAALIECWSVAAQPDGILAVQGSPHNRLMAASPMNGTCVKRFAGCRDGCARMATLIRLRCGSAAPTEPSSVSAARRLSGSRARCGRLPALAR